MLLRLWTQPILSFSRLKQHKINESEASLLGWAAEIYPCFWVGPPYEPGCPGSPIDLRAKGREEISIFTFLVRIGDGLLESGRRHEDGLSRQ